MGDATSRKNKLRKVRIILKKISWKKILTFLFFVVIAGILWFMQIYNQIFETRISIPVKYTSIPDSIIFNDTLPSHINVRLKEEGYNIFKYAILKKDTININISSTINQNNSSVINQELLESYIRKALSRSAFIISFNPIDISLSHSKLLNKKVPVVFDAQINLSSGYFLNSDIRIVPDSVTVYGSLADLDKVTYVYTTNDTISGLEANRKIAFNLINYKNLKLVPDKVNAYIPVEAYTQKKIRVPVECFNLPDNLSIKFFPSKVMLSFFVGISRNDSISADEFTVAVDYNGIKESKTSSIPVRITRSPDYAKGLMINPPNVEYIFEYKRTK